MVRSERIIIVAHYLLYGAAHALRDYLLNNKAKYLTTIFLPLATQRAIMITSFQGKKKIYESIQRRKKSLGFLEYILDIIVTTVYVFKQKSYDVYIGFDALNCITGLLLKKIGKVRKVIFYSIDFVPIRFSNRLLNFIYHKIEIYCVKNADEVWNVSPRIAEGRTQFLHVSEKEFPQKVVPIGIWNSQVKKRSIKDIKKHQLLFLGHILEKQGVQMVLEALPEVIKKIPDITFIVAGGGEYLDELKIKVKQLSLHKHVIFTDWIIDRKKIDTMMSESAVAVATYKPEKEKLYNFTYYADPTKLKDYLSAGLPIILTNISYNAQDIAKKRCGILVQYDRKNIASAIIKLLRDRKTLIEYRKNALQYAKEYDWGNIFKKVTI